MLLKYLRRFNPEALFLMETRKNRFEMEMLRLRFGFDSCLTVDSIGQTGGLSFLWKKEIFITVKSFSESY